MHRRGKTTWLDLQQAAAVDIEELKKHVPKFEEEDSQVLLRVGQRPHLEQRQGYSLLVLFFPVYNRATREIEPAEIDFVLNHEFLATAHDGRLSTLLDLLAEARDHHPAIDALMEQGPRHLVVGILERLLAACNPMLDHISVDLHEIDQQIFRGQSRKTVREILIARRNITDFRKIMQAHKNTLKKLLEDVSRDAASDAPLRLSIESLINRTKDIWDHLESYKESIVDLHDTHESLISDNLNEIMKKYTTMSVVIFSMTLVASLFSLRAGGTPLVGNRFGFWLVAGLLVLVALGMLEYFKKRKWL